MVTTTAVTADPIRTHFTVFFLTADVPTAALGAVGVTATMEVIPFLLICYMSCASFFFLLETTRLS